MSQQLSIMAFPQRGMAAKRERAAARFVLARSRWSLRSLWPIRLLRVGTTGR